MSKIASDAIKRALRIAQDNQAQEYIKPQDQLPVPAGAYNVFVFFNIEAVDGEGHAILGLGPVNEPIMTYSYYREGDALKAPALMACLKDPETFEAINEASGWIVHGNEGNWWNEHVDAALALFCPQETYEPIKEYAEKITKDPGTYDFVKHNCLDFVEDALQQGGIELLTHSKHALRNIAPRDAFQDTRKVKGAKPYGKWKYWFPIAPAPENGFRVIPDMVS